MLRVRRESKKREHLREQGGRTVAKRKKREEELREKDAEQLLRVRKD